MKLGVARKYLISVRKYNPHLIIVVTVKKILLVRKKSHYNITAVVVAIKNNKIQIIILYAIIIT